MERALKEIIGKYPKAVQDEKLLKALLKDYFPENKRMQNMLVMVLDSGILADIVEKDKISKFQMLGYIKCLANDYGISETSAKDAVEQWATALEIKFEKVTVQDEPTKKIKKTGDTIDYSDMGIDDLEITGKVIRVSGKGNKVIPNVRITAKKYIVKAKKCNTKAHDETGEWRFISTAKYADYDESVFDASFLNRNKPFLLEVESDGNWELEMIPFTD